MALPWAAAQALLHTASPSLPLSTPHPCAASAGFLPCFFPLQLIGAFLGTAMTLLRIIPLIIFWVKSKFLAGTERAKVGAFVEGVADVSSLLGAHPDN